MNEFREQDGMTDDQVAGARLRERERGASLVEAALVLPLLIALVLGRVDFGMAVADYKSLRQGNRGAVRRATVANVNEEPGDGL